MQKIVTILFFSTISQTQATKDIADIGDGQTQQTTAFGDVSSSELSSELQVSAGSSSSDYSYSRQGASQQVISDDLSRTLALLAEAQWTSKDIAPREIPILNAYLKKMGRNLRQTILGLESLPSPAFECFDAINLIRLSKVSKRLNDSCKEFLRKKPYHDIKDALSANVILGCIGNNIFIDSPLNPVKQLLTFDLPRANMIKFCTEVNSFFWPDKLLLDFSKIHICVLLEKWAKPQDAFHKINTIFFRHGSIDHVESLLNADKHLANNLEIFPNLMFAFFDSEDLRFLKIRDKRFIEKFSEFFRKEVDEEYIESLYYSQEENDAFFGINNYCYTIRCQNFGSEKGISIVGLNLENCKVCAYFPRDSTLRAREWTGNIVGVTVMTEQEGPLNPSLVKELLAEYIITGRIPESRCV